MSKNKDKKLRIFKVFSQNLEWITKHPTFTGNLKASNNYICPICLRIFDESSLEQGINNPLTIEHVPPEALGGKSKLLTCKECNSKSGHLLDGQLYKLLLQMDFDSFLPNSKTKATFDLNGNKVNGSVEIDNEGVWSLRLMPQYSNPKHSESFFKDFKMSTKSVNPMVRPPFVEQFKSPTFKFSKRNSAQIKRAEVAVLRIAYLYLFSIFGNSVLLNPFLDNVRKQILSPDEDILPRPFWIKYYFAEEWDGINLIRSPKELRCFLIIFNLKTDSGTRKIAIALPGPYENGLDIYENIKTLLGTDGLSQNVTLDHINDEGFVLNEKDIFAYLGYWNGIQD